MLVELIQFIRAHSKSGNELLTFELHKFYKFFKVDFIVEQLRYFA